MSDEYTKYVLRDELMVVLSPSLQHMVVHKKRRNYQGDTIEQSVTPCLVARLFSLILDKTCRFRGNWEL